MLIVLVNNLFSTAVKKEVAGGLVGLWDGSKTSPETLLVGCSLASAAMLGDSGDKQKEAVAHSAFRQRRR